MDNLLKSQNKQRYQPDVCVRVPVCCNTSRLSLSNKNIFKSNKTQKQAVIKQ